MGGCPAFRPCCKLEREEEGFWRAWGRHRLAREGEKGRMAGLGAACVGRKRVSCMCGVARVLHLRAGLAFGAACLGGSPVLATVRGS